MSVPNTATLASPLYKPCYQDLHTDTKTTLIAVVCSLTRSIPNRQVSIWASTNMTLCAIHAVCKGKFVAIMSDAISPTLQQCHLVKKTTCKACLHARCLCGLNDWQSNKQHSLTESQPISASINTA